MRQKSHKLHDLELDENLFLDFRVENDSNGNPVISQITIGFERSNLPDGGLTTSMLRNIRVSDLLINWFLENPKSFLSSHQEKTLWHFLKTNWIRQGSKGISQECYAALSYFYVKASESSPNNPTSALAESLKISVKTAQTRLTQARRLGLLSNTASRSGKASGVLTSHARKIIKELVI